MKKLKEYLAGKSKGDFAKMIGTSPSYLSQLLSGHRRPSYARMCEIHKATDGFVSLDDWRVEA